MGYRPQRVHLATQSMRPQMIVPPCGLFPVEESGLVGVGLAR